MKLYNPAVLEKYRLKLGLSKGEVAAGMQKTAGWYTRICSGKIPLNPKHIPQMANVLQVSPKKLAKEYYTANELEDTSSKLSSTA